MGLGMGLGIGIALASILYWSKTALIYSLPPASGRLRRVIFSNAVTPLSLIRNLAWGRGSQNHDLLWGGG